MDRRVRTFWVLRDRFRRLSFIGGTVGFLAVAAFLGSILVDALRHGVSVAPTTYLWSALLLGLGFLVPYQAVRTYWNVRYRRNHERWQ